MNYGDVKAIVYDVLRDVAQQAELIALRAEVSNLEASGKLTREELDALKARVVAATGRTQRLEDKADAATPKT